MEVFFLLRSRCRYEDLGGKANQIFFLNLESGNFTSEVISKLTNDNFTDTPDILNYQKSYYNVLYIQRL